MTTARSQSKPDTTQHCSSFHILEQKFDVITQAVTLLLYYFYTEISNSLIYKQAQVKSFTQSAVRLKPLTGDVINTGYSSTCWCSGQCPAEKPFILAFMQSHFCLNIVLDRTHLFMVTLLKNVKKKNVLGWFDKYNVDSVSRFSRYCE